MARFHIYKLKSGRGFVVVLQADLLDDLKTRVVAPLFRSDLFRTPVGV